MQSEHDKLAAKVAKIQADVDQVEARAIESRRRQTELASENRAAIRQIRVLEARKKEAQRIITQNDKTIKALLKRNRELSRRQAQLQNSVDQLDARVSSQRDQIAGLQ